jgi:hypothetical protein
MIISLICHRKPKEKLFPVIGSNQSNLLSLVPLVFKEKEHWTLVPYVAELAVFREGMAVG